MPGSGGGGCLASPGASGTMKPDRSSPVRRKRAM